VPQYFLDGHSIFWTATVFFGRPQYFLDSRSIFWTAAVFFGWPQYFLDGRRLFCRMAIHYRHFFLPHSSLRASGPVPAVS
jgi:hypothetical protein